MRIFSYVVRYDVGFAPNPYFGVCSLATCKPDIRKRAGIGDWILGTGSAEHGRAGKLVYAMKVDTALSFDEYWTDPRFHNKRARMGASHKVAHGDNIYHRDAVGAWHQEDSRHSFQDGTPNPGHIVRDTGVDRVILGHKFVYFGGDGPDVPSHLRDNFDLVQSGRGYRNQFPDDQVNAAVAWIESLGTGVLGRPRDWPRDTHIAVRRIAS